MKRTAFIFPGQGAQYVGMARDVYENNSKSREIFERASRALGFSMEDLIFKGSGEDLRITENTQPAMVTASLALAVPLFEEGIIPFSMAGLSIGEYSALVLSGAMEFEECIRLVKKRGRYMQEAVPEGEGTMAAIIGLKTSQVMDICTKARDFGVVDGANFNCPGQVVIAGSIAGVKRAVQMALEAGAKRAVMLNVSGPFHSEMLGPAAEKLGAKIVAIDFKEPKIPVVSNVTARYHSRENIGDLLISQVMSCVLWEDSIRFMIKEGVEEFVEIGPGKVLTGFIKRIDSSVSTFNIDNLESLLRYKRQSL